MIMKCVFVSMFVMFSLFVTGQTISDIFSSNDVQVSWLGIDYSHVKLMGDFSQLNGAGQKNSSQIRDTYFPAWNQLVLNEPQKFDIKGMINKEIVNDIDMIKAINASANTNDIEVTNPPNYTNEDIKRVISSYPVENKKGIGVLFIAECLNKTIDEAYYHVVFLSMPSNEILLSERIMGKPAGVGLRNFWAGSVYSVIKKVKSEYYKTWKSKYSKKG